jgi:anti-sigma regulatory factor (Ser/Thr protein kinase)
MKRISSLALPARLENLHVFIASAIDAARSAGVDPKTVFNVELALEEALVNIIKHAYAGREGDIQLVCGVDNRGWFVMEILDSGSSFDVTAAPAPDLSTDLDGRRIGGLGIHFVRSLMDEVIYRREGEKNILELHLRAIGKGEAK